MTDPDTTPNSDALEQLRRVDRGLALRVSVLRLRVLRAPGYASRLLEVAGCIYPAWLVWSRYGRRWELRCHPRDVSGPGAGILAEIAHQAAQWREA